MIIGKRVLEGKNTTPGGYPLPLSGKALTKTPVIIRQEGVSLKGYPDVFIPGQEELGADEIRVTCIGSGNPPVRRAQAATGWLPCILLLSKHSMWSGMFRSLRSACRVFKIRSIFPAGFLPAILFFFSSL